MHNEKYMTKSKQIMDISMKDTPENKIDVFLKKIYKKKFI